ncbi:hypothetical protein SRHO_G00016420 [Serrasalmus rhombeus]
MAASGPDDEFEYDKPGAERSRRRRGDDDDLDSDLEGDLLEEDWLSSKKNPSELSDEELNDDLLQSDEEDQNTSCRLRLTADLQTARLGIRAKIRSRAAVLLRKTNLLRNPCFCKRVTRLGLDGLRGADGTHSLSDTGPVDFQQHLQGNFVQPQRPPLQEPWRGPPPPHQEREPFFNNEPRFPGQHIFDLPGPAPLMNNNILPLAGQGPLSFPQPGGPGGVGGAPGPGPGFGPLGIGQGQGPPGPGGMFQREPPRPNLQHTSPPAPPGPRGFLGHRQPFPPQQPGPPFSPQHMPFGMQVRQRGLMQPHSQPQHHDLPSHHPLHQQQHRQDVQSHGHPQPQPPPPHHQHQHQQHQHQQHHQRQPGEPHPIMHLSHSPFRQPLQGGPRQMQQRSQNGQQRNNPGRMRMASPSSLQPLQSPQRNSNLRELPIAPSNHPVRPSAPAGQARPVTRATQEIKPGQGVAAGAVGRGQGVARAGPAPSEAKKESPPTQPSTPAQDPDEDEETRQYRLKIEEQKRLREEILRRKEMRRQMQAGVRKKELLERIGGLNPTPTAPTQPVPQPQPAPQPAQPVPSSLAPNGAPQTPSLPRGNVKTSLQSSGLEPHAAKPEPSPQLQQLRKPPTQQNPQRQFPNPTGDVQPPQAVRPGGKRTVMQRANSGGAPQVPQILQIPHKVRVVKRLTGVDPVPSPGAPSAPLPHQHQQQPQQQQLGRPIPQQRVSAVRKVTVGTGGAQQPQEPAGVTTNQTNRVVVPGRGRGRGAQVGRGGGGRMTTQQNRPNPRVPDSQPSTVSIDGLSSTTTEKQIKNLLNSIGPIQMFKMLPDQRKAIAKFVNPQHALSFQHSFHRHMIDLSHIDVTIIEG